MTRSPLAETAAKIRAAISTAGAEQDLPPYPPQATIKVRCRRASLTEAIDIRVENVPREWLVEDPARSAWSGPALLLSSVLLQIARRYFQADGVSSFLDVQFHIAGED